MAGARTAIQGGIPTSMRPARHRTRQSQAADTLRCAPGFAPELAEVLASIRATDMVHRDLEPAGILLPPAARGSSYSRWSVGDGFALPQDLFSQDVCVAAVLGEFSEDM